MHEQCTRCDQAAQLQLQTLAKQGADCAPFAGPLLCAALWAWLRQSHCLETSEVLRRTRRQELDALTQHLASGHLCRLAVSRPSGYGARPGCREVDRGIGGACKDRLEPSSLAFPVGAGLASCGQCPWLQSTP